MKRTFHRAGLKELRAVRNQSRGLYYCIALFSVFVNALMLTGPLYMMQVYDRVLGSRSEATLLALSLLVVFLYGMMGLLDFARAGILLRAGARFQAALDRRVFSAMVRRSAVAKDPVAETGLSDLEAIQRLISSPVLAAAFDVPWTPLFLAGIMLFHPWLGSLALGGGAVLVGIALLNRFLTRTPQQNAAARGHRATLMSEAIRTEAETIQSLGMRDAAFQRWKLSRDAALRNSISAKDLGGFFTASGKTLRLFLQSALLGLGAYLVLQGEMTAGAIIAVSVLTGRALAPIETVIGQWPLVERASQGWRSLAELLDKVPEEEGRTSLPSPKAILEVEALAVVPPGDTRLRLRDVTFRVEPGQAVGVIGPSGSGKSTLARALTAIWQPASGTVRLDGAAIGQYAPDTLGRHIGYLPQRVQMFDGTIAENIARLSMQPDAEKVVAAAKKAAAHEMIVGLPEGYDTQVSMAGGRLSGGQLQRIGLARALYGDPVIVILDEPNSNLDSEGSQALNRAIQQLKSEGAAVLIMAHRPAAIQACDLLLVLDGGKQKAFGPRDAVLQQTVTNHQTLRQVASVGGAP
jgi:PrtD family type I secretion system ABC transporter